jgi:hypothetical protein
MDVLLAGLIAVIVVLSVLVSFDVLAFRFGVDSRDGIGDDHQRPFNG